MTDASGSPRLQVMKAVEDGWNAFTRSPWPFVLFVLLTGVLSVVFQIIGNVATATSSDSVGPGVIVGTIVSFVGSTIVSLWGVNGLIRGAWKALDGKRPGFTDLARWDGGAAGRLFVTQLVLGLICGIILVLAMVIAGGLAQVHQALALIPVIAALVVFLYLAINQTYLPWIAVLQSGNPFDTIQRGRVGVDPSWWWVVLLLIVEVLILVIGFLLCGIGLLAASPVVICISTAAYRQLFGTDDTTGFLS